LFIHRLESYYKSKQTEKFSKNPYPEHTLTSPY